MFVRGASTPEHPAGVVSFCLLRGREGIYYVIVFFFGRNRGIAPICQKCGNQSTRGVGHRKVNFMLRGSPDAQYTA